MEASAPTAAVKAATSAASVIGERRDGRTGKQYDKD